MNFLEELKKRVLVLDGAMGTEILRRKGTKPEFAEWLNFEEPDLILSIHRDYVEAGADIIETNTFSANLFKLRQLGISEDKLHDIIFRGVELARKAAGEKAFVAGSVGSTGELIKPLGNAEIDEIYENYYKIAHYFQEAGADLVQLETMIDLFEAKIAVRAAKDAASLPVLVSMTFTEKGRTVTGSDPETAYHVLEATDADVLSANCGREIEEFVDITEVIRSISSKPIAIYPNAGLPKRKGEHLYYDMTPEEFLNYVDKFFERGANILGGCCGTTPEFIRLIAEKYKGQESRGLRGKINYFFVASRVRISRAGSSLPVMKVGERINPFGSKKLAPVIQARDIEGIAKAALNQQRAGADALDVNLGEDGEKDPDFFRETFITLSHRTNLPLFVDVKNPTSIEAALKAFPGRSVINSSTVERSVMETLLPLAKRYWAGVIALCLDEGGIATTAKEKLRTVEKFLDYALSIGLRKEDIIVDPVTLSVATGHESVRELLLAISEIKRVFELPIILGLSNVSYGLPRRKWINSAFLSMAIEAGADAFILNVEDETLMSVLPAAEVLAGRDPAARRYIAIFGQGKEKIKVKVKAFEGQELTVEEKLKKAILEGSRKEARQTTLQLLEAGEEPLKILNEILIPAMKEVGDLYEKKVYFLPQLISSSEAMKAASQIIEKNLKLQEKASVRKKVVLATVKGDLHDIGKNIVKVLFQNFGFEVVDLGKDVAPEKVLQAIEEHEPDLVGLSCLMTTTLESLEKTVKLIKKRFPSLPVIVGGATVTPAFQKEIGADAFGKDAVDGLKKAKSLLGEEG